MKRESTTSLVVLLIALATAFVLYISLATSPTTISPPSPEQQRDVAKLKKQLALLEERVDLLYERQAEPRRYRELP
jgi:hypothetical protein